MKITDEMVKALWGGIASLCGDYSEVSADEIMSRPRYSGVPPILRAALEAAFAPSPAADMLAALKAMVAWFDDDDSFCLSDEDSCDNCVGRRKEWRIACAAIAKAEGRTEATDD